MKSIACRNDLLQDLLSLYCDKKEKFRFRSIESFVNHSGIDSCSDGHLKFEQISIELANATSVHTECSLRNKLASCLP